MYAALGVPKGSNLHLQVVLNNREKIASDINQDGWQDEEMLKVIGRHNVGYILDEKLERLREIR